MLKRFLMWKCAVTPSPSPRHGGGEPFKSERNGWHSCRLIPGALALSAVIWSAVGCTPPPPAAPPATTPPTVGTNPPKIDEQPRDMSDTKPVLEAVNAEMKKHADSYPKGAVLESVTVRNRLATLDFSSEFNKLGSMGDTTEANAQKYIRHALAKFPVILTMTVKVQGKPYDSQMEDWVTPFPVRQNLEEIDSSKSTSQEGSAAGDPKQHQGGGG